MTWSIESAAAVDLYMEPDDLRQRLIVVADSDAELKKVIAAATQRIERYTGRSLVAKTVTQYMDCFPSSRVLQLKVFPIASITSVMYDDADDQEQAFIDYTARLLLKPSYLYSTSWPSTSDMPGSVRVEMEAGASTEAELQQAFLMLCGHWLENREGFSESRVYEMPMGIRDLLGQFRLRV